MRAPAARWVSLSTAVSVTARATSGKKILSPAPGCKPSCSCLPDALVRDREALGSRTGALLQDPAEGEVDAWLLHARHPRQGVLVEALGRAGHPQQAAVRQF